MENEKRKLSLEECEEIFEILKARFEIVATTLSLCITMEQNPTMLSGGFRGSLRV